jgi:hypothetical protein
MLYIDTLSNVVMRSKASTTVTSTEVPGAIWSTGCGLYFTLSLWSDCSVMLMRTTLGSAS